MAFQDTSRFIPGLRLSERFFREAVEPLLAKHLPELRYGAARLAHGSDVLGFDTARSMDHDWGPQVGIFIAESDFDQDLPNKINDIMAEELPFEIDGIPTHFAPNADGTAHLELTDKRPIAHRVRTTTTRRFFRDYLDSNPLDAALTPIDWLVMPEQRLRTVTTGLVFRDDLGELERARSALSWYPRDVWLYLLAAQWRRLGQEEAFPGRTAEVGDELGSRVLAGRQVRELMHLCFLIERQYAPYSKWFGTAFRD